MAAENVDSSIGQCYARVAVGVVEHPFRIAILIKRCAVQGEVSFVQQRCMKLSAVLERVRMADVEYELSFHSAIGDDACRHTLAQALTQEITAVCESLKRIIWRASHTEAKKRIETMKNVS